MKKKISFIIVLVCSYLIINKYTSIDTDPCDIKCDNCITIITTDKTSDIIVLVSGTSFKTNQVKIPIVSVAIPNPFGLTYQ